MQGGRLFLKKRKRDKKLWIRKLTLGYKCFNTGMMKIKKLYTEWGNYCKQVCRKNKRDLEEAKLSQMEENYKHNVVLNFYQDGQKQTADYQHKTVYYKNKQTQLVSGEYKINRWVEYFSELLNAEEELEPQEKLLLPNRVNIIINEKQIVPPETIKSLQS